jgi:N-methylhydantoinase A
MNENVALSPGEIVAGVDVGGTFTDLLLIDGSDDGSVRIAKVPTTVDNQAFGVISALDATGMPVEHHDDHQRRA